MAVSIQKSVMDRIQNETVECVATRIAMTTQQRNFLFNTLTGAFSEFADSCGAETLDPTFQTARDRSKAWSEILDLCRSLGMDGNGASSLESVKEFIKGHVKVVNEMPKIRRNDASAARKTFVEEAASIAYGSHPQSSDRPRKPQEDAFGKLLASDILRIMGGPFDDSGQSSAGAEKEWNRKRSEIVEECASIAEATHPETGTFIDERATVAVIGKYIAWKNRHAVGRLHRRADLATQKEKTIGATVNDVLKQKVAMPAQIAEAIAADLGLIFKEETAYLENFINLMLATIGFRMTTTYSERADIAAALHDFATSIANGEMKGGGQ
jgi:hypothetical protein